MTSYFGKRKIQAGLSLVELMIALLISTILLLGVLELFGSSSQTERTANAMARLQENGRLAMDLIGREARRTGFYGCDAVPGVLNADKLNFGAGGELLAGEFPGQSLKDSTDDSLIFRYFAPGNGDAVTSGNCNNSQLQPYYVQFKNCSNKGICVDSTGATNQILLNNGKIKEVRYVQPCKDDSSKTCYYSKDELPKVNSSTSFADVSKLQVTLELCDYEKTVAAPTDCTENGAIKRTFSSLIELRNRLQ